jgi:alpha-beta hydrolase superfamily lysophospholipase
MFRPLGLVLSLALLAGCAPLLVQSPLTPPAAFKGPRLTDTTFTSFDGTQLPVMEWKAQGEPWAVIIGVHGFDDYANAFHLAGPVWAQDGVTTIAYDQRGFGRAPRRGIWPGTELLTRDLKTLVPLVRAQYPRAIIAVAGVSMGGGASIISFSGDDAPPIDRLVLLSPAVWGWSSQPLAYKTALFTVGHIAPALTLGAPHIGAKVIHTSDNRQELIAMGHDPNMLFDARTDVLYGMVDLMQSAWEDAGKVKPPTLYLYGAHDEVIPKNAAFHAAAALPAGDKTGYYKDGYHLLLVDKQRERVIRDVEGFLRDPKAPLASGVPSIPKKKR